MLRVRRSGKRSVMGQSGHGQFEVAPPAPACRGASRRLSVWASCPHAFGAGTPRWGTVARRLPRKCEPLALYMVDYERLNTERHPPGTTVQVPPPPGREAGKTILTMPAQIWQSKDDA